MATKSVIPEALQAYRDEWKMSPGIICNGLLFLTGMTGHRMDGTVSQDPEKQIREAFDKISNVLTEAHLTTNNIVEMTSYHVRISEHIDLFRTIREEFIHEPYPAWTAIEVSGFITSGVIVEIRVIADATGLT